MIDFAAETPEDHKTLIVLGEIGAFIIKHFNGLKKVSDWLDYYTLLTDTYFGQLDEEETWDTNEAPPSNINDLMWKTKVRALSMHPTALADVEAQKRTVSVTCALMGITPVTSIADSVVGDDKIKIPSKMNPCRLVNESWRSLVTPLIHNQSTLVTVKIGILKTSQEETDPNRLNGRVRDFYKALSAKRADAASKAEERSWKDVLISVIHNRKVRKTLLPADFDDKFFQKKEAFTGREHVDLVHAMQVNTGRYLHEWGKDCQHHILDAIHSERASAAVARVLPQQVDCGKIQSFTDAVNKSYQTKSYSIWYLPRQIGTPKAIHTLIYLVFLIGPSNCDGTKRNGGLENLEAIIKASGRGIKPLHEACFACQDQCYEQSVSTTTWSCAFYSII